MLAKRSGCTFIGMPGYPAAFTTNLMFHVLPALRRAYGQADNEFKVVDAVLKTDTRAKEGRFELNRAIVEVEDGQIYVSDAGTQKKHHTTIVSPLLTDFYSWMKIRVLLLRVM